MLNYDVTKEVRAAIRAAFASMGIPCPTIGYADYTTEPAVPEHWLHAFGAASRDFSVSVVVRATSGATLYFEATLLAQCTTGDTAAAAVKAAMQAAGVPLSDRWFA